MASPKRRVVALSILALAAPSRRARAETAPVDVRAENVELDARTKELVLEGNVRIESPPFYLRSDKLRARRTDLGVQVEGPGLLAFCPCLGSPLAIGFERAIVAPPGDLVLTSPRLDVYGVPIFWLPYFWLRSTGRAGLLPPDVAYRGKDGVYLGAGAHFPWRFGDEAHGLELRGGWYLKGGAAADARLVTPASSTHLRWDHLGDDGVAVDARGATTLAEGAAPQVTTAAWDVDALRGARAVVATTELDAAARRYDRAAAQASLADAGWTAATGVRAALVRGGPVDDLGAVGPSVTLRRSDAIFGAGAYDATIEGGALHDSARTTSYARGAAGVALATRVGAFGASVAARGAGDVAATSDHRTERAGAASARAAIALPLGRAFASSDATDPWLHRLEPSVAVSALAVHEGTIFEPLAGGAPGAVEGGAWIGEARLATALGRWGARTGFEAVVAGGAIAPMRDAVAAKLASRARAAASSAWLALGLEAAQVWTGADAGGVLVAHGRLGARDAVHVSVDAAGRERIDPVAARALADAPLEPPGGFLSRTGWTGGAGLTVPWTRFVLTYAGADADLTARELVAARASFEVRGPCGCLAIRGTGAHRIGRDGVDVWITIDLAPTRP